MTHIKGKKGRRVFYYNVTCIEGEGVMCLLDNCNANDGKKAAQLCVPLVDEIVVVVVPIVEGEP